MTLAPDPVAPGRVLPERPLRIAMVCPYDLSRPGGVQNQATGLTRCLRALGHEVLLVAPDDRLRGWSREAGDPSYSYVPGRATSIRANGSVAPVSVSLLAAGRAVIALGEWAPDVVHLHEPLAPAVGYGLLLVHRWPMVGTFHRAGAVRGAGLVGPVARRALRPLGVRVAVSEAARETAQALGGGAYEVLFNGVDVDRFARARPARPARSEVPAVLFVGRHEHRKGLGVLLEAHAALRNDAVLWIAGTGPETERLRGRHPESDRVRWLGLVGDDEVASRLAGARVLCAPALGGESFGIVLLEAMAARCAVVASDIPGYRAAAGGHAVLSPPGDAPALARALDRILSEPPDDPTLDGAAAHAREWSMEALARRYVGLYRAAAAPGGPGTTLVRR